MSFFLLSGLPIIAMKFDIVMALYDEDAPRLKNVLRKIPKGTLGFTLGKYLFSEQITPETAKVLIDHGADVHCRSIGLFRTPLFTACSRGNIDLVKLYLAYGVDVDARDVTRRTALDEAKAQGNPEIIALLERGQKIQRLLKENNAPNIVTLLRNREIYGTFHSPH